MYLQNELQNIQFFAERIGIEYTAVEQIDSVLDARIKNTLDQIGEKEKECNWIKELFQFYQGDANDMNAMIEAELKHANIDYIKGSDYILKYQGSIERIVEKIPFLPYAILVSKDSYAKVERIQLNEYTKTILPILIISMSIHWLPSVVSVAPLTSQKHI